MMDQHPAGSLPAPEFTVETYTGPISPRTYRQTLHNRLILERFLADGIDLSTDERSVELILRGRNNSTDPEWLQAANTLLAWLHHNDVASLARVLTDPQEKYYSHHMLSPLITRYGTAEEGKRVRAATKGKVQYA